MTHEELLKLDGKRCTCKIVGTFISDAKIRVEKGKVYICQNYKDGFTSKNQLGYSYSWFISSPSERYEDYCRGCTDIKLLDKTMEDLQVGDLVVDKDGEYKRRVLGICGEVCFLSEQSKDKDSELLKCFSYCVTHFGLKELGYKLVDEEETIEINGKKYNKAKVDERLKELEEEK